MKAKLVLGLIAVMAVGIVVTVRKPASPPPTALEQTSKNGLESPANETITPVKPAFAPRRATVQPQVQDHAAPVAADFLAQIQAALGSTNFRDREMVFTHLLAEWVHTDPRAAAQFAETNSIGSTHEQILQRVAQLWAAADFSSALDWAATLNHPADRDATLTEVCLQLVERDPAEAVRIRSQFVTDEKPNAGLEAVIQRWAERDISAALDWGLSRPAGKQRDQLVARVAYVQAQTSPFDAATLVTQKIPPGKVQTEAAIAVLNQWASHDMAAAGQWVASFPEGDLRARGFKELGIVTRIQTAGQPR
jgi:hypothetical protein